MYDISLLTPELQELFAMCQVMMNDLEFKDTDGYDQNYYQVKFNKLYATYPMMYKTLYEKEYKYDFLKLLYDMLVKASKIKNGQEYSEIAKEFGTSLANTFYYDKI